MNRFRTRRKAKEAAAHAAEPEAPPVPSLTSAFKKGKKGQPEKKDEVEVDLTSALPSSDDFRTSLLMPNLSARFSMLKEQDDPSSKLGKANDDSVLFPKRASRLNLFGNSQLADISEVSSVHGSARPSLAMGCTDSYVSGDGYGTDEDSQSGSVMSRSRPGEGNNLFGGRQKVYKIPTGAGASASGSKKDSASEAPEDAGSGTSMGGGKFIYENDVAFSAFQKYREQERQKQRQLELEISEQLHENTQKDEEDVSSPSLPNYSRNRTTSSSTTSGPSNNRTSTAATSIDSQSHSSVQGPSFFNPPTSNNAATLSKQNSGPGVDRSQTKTRRLYGQGLEQAAQNQQSSALNRLESLSRQRGDINDPTMLGRSQSRSATSLNERFRGISPVYASPGFPSASPTPSTTSPGLRSPDGAHREGSVNSTGSNPGFMPPLSPPASEGEDAGSLAAAVQPEDRGKATALGLFNKPAAKYDDDQFSKLQRQMHEGRNTPPQGRGSPADVSRPAPRSSGKPEELPSTTYSSNPEPAKEEKPSDDLTTSDIDSSPSQPGQGTFFTTMSDSDSEEDEGSGQPLKKASPATSQAFDGLHPAFRTTSSELEHSDTTFDFDSRTPHIELPDRTYPESRDLNTIEENQDAETPPSPIEEETSEKAPDSPTLGPSGLGLSGLVNSQLRRNSDRSSFYPQSPAFPPRSGEEEQQQYLRSSIPPPGAYNQAASIHSNPWEYDDIDTSPPDDPNISAMSMKARQILGQASALSNQDSPNTRKRGGQELHPEAHAISTGQDELQPHHHRDGSSETQQERDDFSKELAERRKKVQEKLMNVDGDSRPNSPSVAHRGSQYSPAKSGNAFAMLKTNNSGDSLSGMPDKPQSKAMKMLGIDNANMNSSAPNLGQTDVSRGADQRTVQNNSYHSGPVLSQNRQRGPRHQPTYRGSDDDVRNYGTDDSPPQSSFGSRRRDRSSSDVSKRSRTPNRYREDLGSVDEGPGLHSSYPVDEHKMNKVPTSVPSSVPSSARPSIEISDRHPSDRSASAASERYRSSSRTANPGYFDNKPSSIQTNSTAMIGLSPRPSPVTPYSANATPPLTEASPPGSGVSTPTLNPNSAANAAPRSAGLGTYKKQVAKTQISEPTFISCTSNVPTVGLPAGASLSNGTETPPIPPVNPRRRRQTTTQTIWGALKGGEKQETPAPMPTPPSDYAEEQSTFSDEGEKRSRSRHRLRKTSSEGGNLNAKARQQAMATSNSPAVPKFPPQGKMF